MTDMQEDKDIHSHTLGVDGSKVGVLEEGHEVSLSSLLEGHDRRALEPQVRLCNDKSRASISLVSPPEQKGTTNLEILSNLTDETLEGELADEQLRALLVATDFTESDGTGPETMGLLHTASGGGLRGDVAR